LAHNKWPLHQLPPSSCVWCSPWYWEGGGVGSSFCVAHSTQIACTVMENQKVSHAWRGSRAIFWPLSCCCMFSVSSVLYLPFDTFCPVPCL
jgi:hypothetical protein